MPKKTTKRTSRAAVSDRVAHLTQSARQRELVAVIGTGVSAALTGNKVPAVTWKGLIAHGFDYGLAKGKLTAAQVENWKVQLNSTDIDDLSAPRSSWDASSKRRTGRCMAGGSKAR